MKNEPIVIWITGLSGSGKTTLSSAIFEQLLQLSLSGEIIDGDIVRTEKTYYDFSKQGRIKNNFRIIKNLSKKNTGFIIVATISPFKEIREHAREKFNNYFEIYLSTPLETCIKRDPKGLYKKAQRGLIKNFTGINQDYDVPIHPNVILDNTNQSTNDSIEYLMPYLISFMREKDVL